MEEEPTPSIPPAQPTGQGTNPNNINLGDILLPKKEVHAPDTAQRVNAGALLNQEQAATLAQPPADPAPATPPASNLPPPPPPKPASLVVPLQTYKGDVEKYVRDKNVSVVSAAAAQARQRTEVRTMPVSQVAQEEEAAVGERHSWKFYATLAGGAVCLLAAVGLIYFVLARTGQLPTAPAPQAPFIAVDGVADVAIASGEPRESILADLEKEKEASTLSLGLVEQLRPIVAPTAGQGSANTVTLVGAQQFLATLAPDIPVNLLRTINQEFLLGAHSFSTQQPFLILKTDSYEEAFAGMLAWEGSMRSDLSPLFDYTPSPHINSSPNGQSSIPNTASGANTSSGPSQASVIQNGFADAIVENHDARVLKNGAGDIYFLWTFLDRSTIVITTNEHTLREVISRLKDAPLLLQPGQ